MPTSPSAAPADASRRDRRDDKNSSRAPKDNSRKSRTELYTNSSRSSKHPHSATATNRASPDSDVLLDAIFSAHSDGLMVSFGGLHKQPFQSYLRLQPATVPPSLSLYPSPGS